MNGIDVRIDEWVEAGLVSPGTAAELHRYEHDHLAPPGPAPTQRAASPVPVDVPAASEQARPLALVGEIVGYLGAVLIIVAVSFLLGRTWGDIPTVGRIGIVAPLTALVAVAGALAARSAAGPAQRLASVLLLATVGLTGWLTWVIADQAIGLEERPGLIAITGAMTVVAGGIYAWRRRALAQLAALGTLAALLAVVLAPSDGRSSVPLALAWTALGLAWVGLAMVGRLAPAGVALIGGGLLATQGLQNAAFDDGTGTWMLALQVALAVGMVAVAALRRPLVLLIIPGAIGVMQGIPMLISRLWGDTLAVWGGVLVTGVALVAVAIRMVRGRGRPLVGHA
ncbi:DUF2157 domain-containing protein [Demequina lignilytica]|uniref:DUF2157 domain-containing protein n=1 Tax=Demequina lignilytica TaxID=3051663 RepID=A0AB35MKL5_9MICO|nr:DUF2157 domain-containing protein [Demequina sp. SYSU T0a273]MDN4484361.1 DUF2157 domain-containing protein [Demequina sp. SYSU T0a273]